MQRKLFSLFLSLLVAAALSAAAQTSGTGSSSAGTSPTGSTATSGTSSTGTMGTSTTTNTTTSTTPTDNSNPGSSSTSGTGSGFILVTDLLTGNLSGFGDAAQHLILPAIVVAIGPAVAIGRVLRGGLLVAMSQDHAKTAKAKGMRRFAVLLHHGVRNAMTATLSMAGLQVGLLLTGVVVVETVFAWPGLGLYTSNSLQSSDFPAVMGVTLVLGFVYVIVNALVDIGQLLADPRLRTRR